MHTVLLPMSSDRKRMARRTSYDQAPHNSRIKERKLNWVKVISVAAPMTGALFFTLIYGFVGSMDYNDELLIAQALEQRRHDVVCEASRDEAARLRYNVTLEQVAAENC